MVQVPEFLEQTLGIKMSRSTVEKKFCPSSPVRPVPDCYWGNQPLYKPTTILAWARGRMTPTRGDVAA
jgi:hypothetical protein